MTHLYRQIDYRIDINATASHVWSYLSKPQLMKIWMLDTEMDMDIFTDWQVGSPITMTGHLHHMPFENRGIILTYNQEKELSYSHLSSLSNLPDHPYNYCITGFSLSPMENRTQVHLSISNFPTETIFRHLDFYWRTAIQILKQSVELDANK